jgi:hypothetical protein
MTSELEFIFVMLSYTVLIGLYYYVDEIGVTHDQGAEREGGDTYFIDARGARGGPSGGGGGGGVSFGRGSNDDRSVARR